MPLPLRSILALLLALNLPAFAQAPVAQIAQIEEEELTAPEPAASEPATADEPGLDEAELLALFAEAETIFAEDPLTTLPLFGNLVDQIDSHLADRIAEAEATAAEAEAAIVEEEAAIAEQEAAIAEAEANPAEGGEGGGTEGTSEEGAEESVEEGARDEAEEGAGEEKPPQSIPEVRFLSEGARSILARSLLFRARVHFGFGERELVESGFERMLTIEPGADVDRDRLDPDLVKVFDRVRERLVGDLALVVEPPELDITVDGRRVEPQAGPFGVLAGERWIEAQRPGYLPLAQKIEVEADRQTSLELTLERVSPVIRLHTRPADAEVTLDGEMVGVTGGTAPEGYLPSGRYRSEEFSAQMVLTEVELGLRVLEVRKDGYRPYRAELVIEELIDYPMPPIMLEDESGVLVFRKLPAGAQVQVDGQIPRPPPTSPRR